MTSYTTDEIKGAIDTAASLLRDAIEIETEEAYHRGQTIGAMGVAEGTLRTLGSYLQLLLEERNTTPTPAVLPLDSVRIAGRLDWQALADTVTARRNWLNMSQFDVTKAGGPSEQTQRRIEGCQRCTYEPRSLTRLEHALGWAPNTVRAILEGTISDHQSVINLPTT